MTYDDGIVKFYNLENTAEKGDKPHNQLVFVTAEYFSEKTVGVQRFFTAMANKVRIDKVIDVQKNTGIIPNQIAVDESGNQFEVIMVQLVKDENNLNQCRISLSRLEENYEIA